MEKVDQQVLSDEELDRMAQALFAEVRAEQPEARAERALQTAGAVAGEIVPGLPDWLQETGGERSDEDTDG